MSISLMGSLRTCKPDAGWASKFQSDRFLNPAQMLCPVWNGVDTSGRVVCADSYWTKTPGCNSAMDRVLVENELRPQYMEYVTLDARGIRGQCDDNKAYPDTVCHYNAMKQIPKQVGQFGLVSGYTQNIMPNCATCRSTCDGIGYQAVNNRSNQWVRQGGMAMQNKGMSGML